MKYLFLLLLAVVAFGADFESHPLVQLPGTNRNPSAAGKFFTHMERHSVVILLSTRKYRR